MGIVYEGLPAAGGKPVAIKVFFPDTKINPEETATLLERFEREGSTLAAIDQENVVKVLEVGSQDDMEYIVMEKLEGYNLKELLKLGTRFTLGETFDIMLQLLSGLSACHNHSIIHRDVKPANVVRAPDGRIRLTDFGIARIVTDQTLSREGTIVGTPNYMSPEQIKGSELDARSDLFSCGVMMYELLAGRKPFDGPDMTSIMYNVTNVHPPPPRFYNGSLPTEIDEICFKAMAKDSGERYAGAVEFANAIRNLVQDIHYRDDTESFLSALPAAPDADVIATPITGRNPGVQIAQQPIPSSKSKTWLPQSFPSSAGTVTPDSVFCVDCGMENDDIQEFCSRCMRPLLKRSDVQKLASQQAKAISKVNKGDKLFMFLVNLIMASIAIIIIWLFMKPLL